MKKYLSFLVLFALLTTTGCSANPEKEQAATDTTSSITEQTESFTTTEEFVDTAGISSQSENSAPSESLMNKDELIETLKQLINDSFDLISTYDISEFDPEITVFGEDNRDYTYVDYGNRILAVTRTDKTIEELKQNLTSCFTGNCLEEVEAVIDYCFHEINGQMCLYVSTQRDNPLLYPSVTNPGHYLGMGLYLDYDFDSCNIMEETEDSVRVKINVQNDYPVIDETVDMTIKLENGIWKFANYSYERSNTEQTESLTPGELLTDKDELTKMLKQLINDSYGLILKYDIYEFDPEITVFGEYKRDFTYLDYDNRKWTITRTDKTIDELKQNLTLCFTGNCLEEVEAVIDYFFHVINEQMCVYVSTQLDNPLLCSSIPYTSITNPGHYLGMGPYLDYDFDSCNVIEETEDSIRVKINVQRDYPVIDGIVDMKIKLDNGTWKFANYSYEPSVTEQTESSAPGTALMNQSELNETLKQLINDSFVLTWSYDINNFAPMYTIIGGRYRDYTYLDYDNRIWTLLRSEKTIEELKQNLTSCFTGTCLEEAEAAIDDNFHVIDRQLCMYITLESSNPLGSIWNDFLGSAFGLDFDFDSCNVIEKTEDSIRVKINTWCDYLQRSGTADMTIKLDNGIWKFSNVLCRLSDE